MEQEMVFGGGEGEEDDEDDSFADMYPTPAIDPLRVDSHSETSINEEIEQPSPNFLPERNSESAVSVAGKQSTSNILPERKLRSGACFGAADLPGTPGTSYCTESTTDLSPTTTMMNQDVTIFGEIDGVIPGSVFKSKRELRDSKVHDSHFLYHVTKEGVTSIILDGKFKAVDEGVWVMVSAYSVPKGAICEKTKDGLMKNSVNSLPIRIIRPRDPKYGGYRYDGVYKPVIRTSYQGSSLEFLVLKRLDYRFSSPTINFPNENSNIIKNLVKTYKQFALKDKDLGKQAYFRLKKEPVKIEENNDIESENMVNSNYSIFDRVFNFKIENAYEEEDYLQRQVIEEDYENVQQINEQLIEDEEMSIRPVSYSPPAEYHVRKWYSAGGEYIINDYCYENELNSEDIEIIQDDSPPNNFAVLPALGDNTVTFDPSTENQINSSMSENVSEEHTPKKCVNPHPVNGKMNEFFFKNYVPDHYEIESGVLRTDFHDCFLNLTIDQLIKYSSDTKVTVPICVCLKPEKNAESKEHHNSPEVLFQKLNILKTLKNYLSNSIEQIEDKISFKNECSSAGPSFKLSPEFVKPTFPSFVHHNTAIQCESSTENSIIFDMSDSLHCSTEPLKNKGFLDNIRRSRTEVSVSEEITSTRPAKRSLREVQLEDCSLPNKKTKRGSRQLVIKDLSHSQEVKSSHEESYFLGFFDAKPSESYDKIIQMLALYQSQPPSPSSSTDSSTEEFTGFSDSDYKSDEQLSSLITFINKKS